MKEKVSKKFQEIYGSGAILFASPGRINLIGEHTDYNGGFVFPGAVDKGIVAAIKLNGTDKLRLKRSKRIVIFINWHYHNIMQHREFLLGVSS